MELLIDGSDVTLGENLFLWMYHNDARVVNFWCGLELVEAI